MTLAAVCGVLRGEGFGAVVAHSAALAGLHVLHGLACSGALRHLEDGRMTRIASASLLVCIAAEHDLARAAACELHGLTGAHCERRDRENERYNHYECDYEKLLHSFTSFHREDSANSNIKKLLWR